MSYPAVARGATCNCCAWFIPLGEHTPAEAARTLAASGWLCFQIRRDTAIFSLTVTICPNCRAAIARAERDCSNEPAGRCRV